MLEIPLYPCGAEQPAVVCIRLIGDGREIISTSFIQVRIPVDRCLYHKLILDVSLAEGCGTVALAIVRAANVERERIAAVLTSSGYVDAAVVVLRGGID